MFLYVSFLFMDVTLNIMNNCFHSLSYINTGAEISQETAVNPVDIVSTLQSLQMLKYWKGKHLILKRQVIVIVMSVVVLATYCLF